MRAEWEGVENRENRMMKREMVVMGVKGRSWSAIGVGTEKV